MQKTRNEIIDYLNFCQNCFCTVIENPNKPEAVFVNSWHVFDNIIIIGIDNDKKEMLNRAQNSNIAFAFWSKLEGYQIKGKIIPERNGGDYSDEIDKFKELLMDSKNDLFSKDFALIEITNIFCVTPGNQAGKMLFCECR